MVVGFLYFLDKYTRIIVGGSKAMAEYTELSKGKTLIDWVTVSDIAYSMLVYEVHTMFGWRRYSRMKRAQRGKRRKHSRMLPSTSTMCSVELDLPCSQMGGRVKDAIISILSVMKLKI